MRTVERAIDDVDREAGGAVRRGGPSLAARARAERPGVLTTTTIAVLGQLSRHGAMTAGEPATRLHQGPQALTRPLPALQEQRFLERMPDPDDRRQALLTITPEGREALAEDMRPRDAWLARGVAPGPTGAQ